MKRVIDWLLRNRQTGNITILQLPNAPLATFLILAGADRLFRPTGTVGSVVRGMAAIALLVWAVWEMARGVNPFRRILGGIVLAFEVVMLITR